MKKFFSVISLQQGRDLESCHYKAVENQKLDLGRETCFPIIAVMNAYLQKGEQFSVVVAVIDNEDSRRNYEIFVKEVNRVCEEKGAKCVGLHMVEIPEDQTVTTHAQNFRKLIDYMDDNDTLFCCMTYGTKTLSNALLMAVQYGYRAKKNTSIGCIVYGEVRRSSKEYFIYDMTALVQLDEIVRVLANRGSDISKELIDQILSL